MKSVFRLISPAFSDGKRIPAKYTADGKNMSPPLQWESPPVDTKSFALICDDPDAPMGNWVHWLVKNIPANTRTIDEGAKVGVEVKNDFGKFKYGGPAPPSGTHRYFFKLYALNVETMKAKNSHDFYKEVEEKQLATAILMGLYSRGAQDI